MTLNAIIKEAIDEQGLTTGELARRSGLERNTVQRLIDGNHQKKISFFSVVKIVRVLGLKLDKVIDTIDIS